MTWFNSDQRSEFAARCLKKWPAAQLGSSDAAVAREILELMSVGGDAPIWLNRLLIDVDREAAPPVGPPTVASIHPNIRQMPEPLRSFASVLLALTEAAKNRSPVQRRALLEEAIYNPALNRLASAFYLRSIESIEAPNSRAVALRKVLLHIHPRSVNKAMRIIDSLPTEHSQRLALEWAVFAFAQRNDDRSLGHLLKIAERIRDPAERCRALLAFERPWAIDKSEEDLRIKRAILTSAAEAHDRRLLVLCRLRFGAEFDDVRDELDLLGDVGFKLDALEYLIASEARGLSANYPQLVRKFLDTVEHLGLRSERVERLLRLRGRLSSHGASPDVADECWESALSESLNCTDAREMRDCALAAYMAS